MRIRNTCWLVLCLAALAGAALAQPRPKPVAPGYVFKGGYVNVTAPKADGWFLLGNSGAGMGFAKQGLSKFESLGAQVLMFELAPAQTPEEFVALVRQNIEKSHDPQRFDFLESRIEHTDQRPYPCARYYGIMNDKQARASPTEIKSLRLEVHALYCRHPVRTETGFAAIFSYRGYGTYPNLAEFAKEFIQGVEVPAAETGK